MDEFWKWFAFGEVMDKSLVSWFFDSQYSKMLQFLATRLDYYCRVTAALCEWHFGIVDVGYVS